jgi:hypothetical protein
MVRASAHPKALSLDVEETPSVADEWVWECLAPSLPGFSAWQVQRAFDRAIEAGPEFFPAGPNFSNSPLNAAGLLLLLRVGSLDAEDLQSDLGISPGTAGLLEEASRSDEEINEALARWSAAVDKGVGEKMKPHSAALLPDERDFVVARTAKIRTPLAPLPWPAAIGALRRLHSTRRAYLEMPRQGLLIGAKEEAASRASLRFHALQAFVNRSMVGFQGGYADLDLSLVLSDSSMRELHREMDYGEETPLWHLRREVFFSRLGILDRIVSSRIEPTSVDPDRSVHFDEEGEIGPEVEEACSPLLRLPTGVVAARGILAGRSPQGRDLLRSEAVTGVPWTERWLGLRAAFGVAERPTWAW